MKHARKVALISIFDYPREDYTAYWTISVTGEPGLGFRWEATLHSYQPVGWEWKGHTVQGPRPMEWPWPGYPPNPGPEASAEEQEAWREECAAIFEEAPKPVHLLTSEIGVADTKDEADTAAQQWVISHIEQHRRLSVVPFTAEEVQELVDKLDVARIAGMYGTVDEIRGRLKSRGITITEPSPISAPGKTAWAGNIRPSTSVNPQSGYTLALGPLGLLWAAFQGFIRSLHDLVTFALAYSATVRNNRMTQILNAIDGGAGAGLFRIYDGARPGTCGTATTLLAEITLQDPSGTVASQAYTVSGTPLSDTSANAAGTATWFRIVDSTGTCCVDGSVGTSGSDLNLNSTTISVAQEVQLTSAVITEGNA